VDSATHDMAAQCGACGQPKLDLLRTYHIQGIRVAATRDDGLRRLNSLCYYPKQSIIGHYQRFTQMFAELYTIWQSNVELSAIPNGPPQDTYVVVLLFVGEMTV
jgi:hypothetical protein